MPVGKPFYIANSSATVTNVELLPSLQNVDFDESGVTNEDLRYLKELPNLRVLFLNQTSIGCGDLAHLVDTPIEILHLKDAPLDDSCVLYLSRMKSLKRLIVYDGLSTAAIRELKLALPHCDVQ